MEQVMDELGAFNNGYTGGYAQGRRDARRDVARRLADIYADPHSCIEDLGKFIKESEKL